MKKAAASKPTVPAPKASASVPSIDVINFASDAGKGMEGTTKADMAIPFLTMLQGLSPQLRTVDGAKPGLILNTITNELFSSVSVIPCAYQRRFVRWAPRSQGGGYRGDVSPLDVEAGSVPGMTLVEGTYVMDAPKGTTVFFDKDGKCLFDTLVDTRNYFVLYQSANGLWSQALVSMSSTQVKKAKNWMSQIMGIKMKAGTEMITPAIFSHSYVLGSVDEKNNKGEWAGFSVTLKGPLTDVKLYQAASAFHAVVMAGAVKVTPPSPIHDEADNSRF